VAHPPRSCYAREGAGQPTDPAVWKALPLLGNAIRFCQLAGAADTACRLL